VFAVIEPAICGYDSLIRHSFFLSLVNPPALLACMLCAALHPLRLLLGGDGEDVVLIGNKRHAFLLLFGLSMRWRTSLEGEESTLSRKSTCLCLLYGWLKNPRPLDEGLVFACFGAPL